MPKSLWRRLSHGLRLAGLPRWFHVYVALAAVNLLVAGGMLVLNAVLNNRLTDAVRAAHAWKDVGSGFAELGRLAVAVNSPGNDVFETRDVAHERGRLKVATLQFDQHLDGLRQRLARLAPSPHVAPLDQQIDAIQRLERQMSERAHKVFARVEQRRLEAAADQMAAMDRQLLDLTELVTQAETRLRVVEQMLLEDSARAVERFRLWKALALVLLGCLMLGVVWYGRLMLLAQRDVEKALRLANTHLDERVRQRTSDLAEASEARDRLLQRLFTAQEDERRKIAGELHDGVGQLLVTVLMRLQALGKAATADPHAVDHLQRLVTDGMHDLRRISQGLRPAVLDDLGLAPALERLVHEAAAAGEIEIALDLPTRDERLPDDVESAIYRIVQEAITNIVRHARARRARVVVEQRAEQVEVTISDDGQGIDAGDLGSAEGLGLPGMKERAALLGGSLVVENSPQGGAVVRATIPVKAVSV